MMIIGAMATAVMAQDLSGFDSLPSCGQTCITNMVNLSEGLGCASDDVACMCLNPDFSYGIRDCTDQSCPSSKDATDTQSWGVSLCANQGVAVTSVSNSVAASTASGAAVSTDVTGIVSVTSSLTKTLTSDGSVITTVVPTVVPIVTTTSEGDVATTTVSSGASATTKATTTTTKTSAKNNGGDATSTESTDAASHATAVPVGIMAAAGLAALLL